MRLKDISETSLFSDLRDRKFAADYLAACLDSGKVETFLIGLRNVVNANGGLGNLSRSVKLGRESMYKSLSKTGNPRFATVQEVLHALGFQLSVKNVKTEKQAA